MSARSRETPSTKNVRDIARSRGTPRTTNMHACCPVQQAVCPSRSWATSCEGPTLPSSSPLTSSVVRKMCLHWAAVRHDLRAKTSENRILLPCRCRSKRVWTNHTPSVDRRFTRVTIFLGLFPWAFWIFLYPWLRKNPLAGCRWAPWLLRLGSPCLCVCLSASIQTNRNSCQNRLRPFLASALT